jgi:hypothetical protein
LCVGNGFRHPHVVNVWWFIKVVYEIFLKHLFVCESKGVWEGWALSKTWVRGTWKVIFETFFQHCCTLSTN